MPGLPGSSHDENTYFVDPTSGAEMARLIDQDRLITKGMGGLMSERSDLSGIETILDLACGPGGWAMEMAFEHPEMKVVGIDISPLMVNYASAQAQVQGLDNISFHVMDILNPLDFAASSFDLVNARFLSGFMFPATWPSLMQEVFRVVRPGGFLRFTEGDDWGISSSPALEKMMSLSVRALQRSMQSFLPEGRHIGITPALPRLLRNVGCTNIQKKAHFIDYSAGTEAHYGFYRNWQVFWKLLQPFLLKNGMGVQQQLDQLYEQMLAEMYAEDFQAMGWFLTVWGEKPESEER